MEKKTYSKEEFNALVTELESTLNDMFKAEKVEAQPLAKSEEEAKENQEDKKEEEKKEDQPKAEEQKADEKKDEPKAEEKSDEKKEDDEAHGYDDEDMEEMHKMYGSMAKGELKAHKESIEKCWMAKCGDMTQMAKSETTSTVTDVKIEGTKAASEETLLKSELDSAKKENEDLKKNIEGLVSALNSYVTKKAPARKAITDIEFVKKSEETPEEKPLTKSEIGSILAKKAQDPKLSTKDREAINEFYLTNAGVDKVKHLLSSN